MNDKTMRQMGEPESSIRYWQTQTIYWNGEPVTVQAPKSWPITTDEE